MRKVPTLAAAGVCALLLGGCSSLADSDLNEPLVTTRALPAIDDIREVDPWSEPSSETRHINAGGLKRDYILSLPAGADQRDRLPVILVFHGYGEDAESVRRNSGLDDADAIVAYLDGEKKAWAPAPYAKTSGEQDLDFVDAVLDELGRDYSVDRSRVFAAGFSNGGGFAAYVGCQRPQEFTGIATVAGAYYHRVSEGCSQIPMKHVDFHGTDDDIISYDGGRRHKTAYNSVEEMLTDATERNHCDAREEDIDVEDNVKLEHWAGCDAELAHYRIENGPHVWPGGGNDSSKTVEQGFATDKMLEFFRLGKGSTR